MFISLYVKWILLNFLLLRRKWFFIIQWNTVLHWKQCLTHWAQYYVLFQKNVNRWIDFYFEPQTDSWSYNMLLMWVSITAHNCKGLAKTFFSLMYMYFIKCIDFTQGCKTDIVDWNQYLQAYWTNGNNVLTGFWNFCIEWKPVQFFSCKNKYFRICIAYISHAHVFIFSVTFSQILNIVKFYQIYYTGKILHTLNCMEVTKVMKIDTFLQYRIFRGL
jgi:hypothetical protein